MTPEQKAELRRQCEAEALAKYPDIEWQASMVRNTTPLSFHNERTVHVECLMAERLRVQPLIEAGNELREAGGDVGYEAEEGMPITDESPCMKSLERAEAKWVAALTAYQNTER